MKPAKARVVVTGVGAVTALGSDLPAVHAAIRSGSSAVRAVESFDASSLPQPLGAEVRGEDFRASFRIPKAMKVADLRTRMAVRAAASALAAAGLETESLDHERTGVVIGCSGSDMQVDALIGALRGEVDSASDTALFGRSILSGVSPLWLLVNLPNMVSAHVSIQFDLRGPDNTVMTDWIAGIQSIGEAARLVARGEASGVLAGGADVGVLPIVYANFEQAGLFDRDDAGRTLVPADGAAIFVVEARESALARGAPILAEIEGDDSCAWSPDDAPLSRCVRRALDAAGWNEFDELVGATTGCPAIDADTRELGRSTAAGAADAAREAIGFPLAAASTIDLALAMSGSDRSRRRVLAAALGSQRQAAALALTLFPEEP